MGTGCGQVTIPTVDNTALDCDDFTLSTCVKVVQKCTKVGNLEGENLDKFIQRLCNKIAKMDNEIYILKQKVKALTPEVDGGE